MNRVLCITEGMESGCLGGPHKVGFCFIDENTAYDIIVEQFGIRTITITAPGNVAADKLLGVYYCLKTGLLLLDGRFYQIVQAYDNGTEITASFIKRQLACFNTADFNRDTESRLIDFPNIVTNEFLHNWRSIQRDLDISFKMMLYVMSSVAMPVDMKCAFAIESFIPLAEMLQSRTTDFSLPAVNKGESRLQKYLIAIIERYGQDVFRKECDADITAFTQVLTDSRNRIAHVKEKQGRIVLNGEESVVYLIKLSLLYRVVIFNLLGISTDLYKDKLLKPVNALDAHREIVSRFIAKWRSSDSEV